MAGKRYSSYVVIAGTTAELLKLWPVLRYLGNSCSIVLVLSGQHAISGELLDLIRNTGTEIIIGRSNVDIAGSRVKTAMWLGLAFPRIVLILLRRNLVKGFDFGVIVHGDTLTSFFGAISGRLTGHRVFHIEAGYRTSDWKNPFPEELVRRAVGRIANVHYCPTKNEGENIYKKRAEIIITGGNTGLDSLQLAMQRPFDREDFTPDFSTWFTKYHNNFGIMTLHRFELFFAKNMQAENVLSFELGNIESDIGLIVPLGAFERQKLVTLFSNVKSPNFIIVDKLGYLKFVQLLRNAKFVITDSGGLAQECNALGTPCFVARDAIEDSTLRSNTVMIGTHFHDLANHVNSAELYRLSSQLPVNPSPAGIISEDLGIYVQGR